MIERDLPEVGQIWQHFKHWADEPHIYSIIAITEVGKAHYDDCPACISCQHTETGEMMSVLPAVGSAETLRGDDRTWLHPPQNQPFVVYSSLDDNHCWARPLASFIAKDDRSPNGWKFWRIDAQMD